jgi:hypothetical protein
MGDDAIGTGSETLREIQPAIEMSRGSLME